MTASFPAFSPKAALHRLGFFAVLGGRTAISEEPTDKKGKVGVMSKLPKASMIGLGLFVAGIILPANLPINAAEPEAAADIPNTKVATVLGRDIFRKDIAPSAKWLEDREKYVKLHGEKMGYVTPDVYRLNKLREAIWTPICDKYIPKKDLEPTEEELKEFIVHYRQSKARMKQEQQERQKKLQAEADKLEKLLPSQDDEDQEETTKRIQKMRNEIAAIERSFEIDLEIQNRHKDFDQSFAQWRVRHWKRQQWFYKRYGGRVIFQQVGMEAIDAMRDFLKEAEAKKDFVIYDQDLNTKFWAPFTKDRPGILVPNPDKVFEHPWSSMEPSEDAEKPPVAPAS